MKKFISKEKRAQDDAVIVRDAWIKEISTASLLGKDEAAD